MIEVFKTNVQEANESQLLTQKLLEHFPLSKVSFDLEDCDRVLRVEELSLCPQQIVDLLNLHGFHCEPLPD